MADLVDDPDVTPEDEDEVILKVIRDRFDYALQQWQPIRDEGSIDVKFVSGDTWDPEDRALRAGRPIVNLDQLGQYINQLVNSVRQNKRAIKASPAGSGATDATAELRGNRIREIEYASHAQEAYTVAFENAATRSYGFCRIVAEYEDSASDNQVLRVKAIPNPNQVIPDPDAESTAGADWRYLFFVHTLAKDDFVRDYPDATIKDFTPEIQQAAPAWIKAERVQVGEYWFVTETPSEQGRPIRTVAQYLTNGVELLAKPGRPKRTAWKGTRIPFASCLGKILYRNDAVTGDVEKILQSYVRLARDAAKGYNWTKSGELEALAMPLKAALFAYEGQLSPENLDKVVESLYKPVPVIFAKATTPATGQTVLPLPQRGIVEPPIQAFELAAESFRRDIQNALGRYSAADHRLGNTKVTSGVALRELDKSGDLGSYHFIDHYDDMIHHVGVLLDELLPFYDDTPKEVATRLPDGTAKVQRINTPTQRGPQGEPAFGPDDLRMDVGTHAITLSTGPSFDSQREAGKDAAMTLLQNPHAFPFIAADAMRLMELGPIGDQMAEDLEYLQPPPMQQARAQKEKGGGPDPRQLQQQLQQLTEQLKHAEAALKQMDQELKGKQAEQQVKLQITDKELASKERLEVQLAHIKNAGAVAVAHIAAAARGAAIDQHSEDEALALGHEVMQADLDRQHEKDLTAQEHAQSLQQQVLGGAQQAQQTDQAQQHAVQLGDQQHQQALQQGQQAAALQPPPMPPPDPGTGP